MPSPLHEALVSSLGMSTHRFKKTLLSVMDKCKSGCADACLADDDECVCGRVCTCGRCDLELADYVREYLRLVPDGYAISTERKESRQIRDDVFVVTCAEVDVSHPISSNRMRQYADAWFAFDSSSDWELELVVVDRYGKVRDVDLCALWYGFLAADIKAERRATA